ncbi:MAG: hypothetical protein ACE5JG_13570, partial [Planctomycetota bacterium]
FYDQAYALAAYLQGLGAARDWRAFLRLLGRRSFEHCLTETWSVSSLPDLERGFAEFVLGKG